MKNSVVMGTGLLSVLCLSACADVTSGDTELLGENNSVESAEQAVTGSNPSIDAEYLGELAIPSGLSFVDMAIQGLDYRNSTGTVWATRSDGRLQYYAFDGSSSPVYRGYVGGAWDYLESFDVDSDFWGLIASKNSTRAIYYKVNNVPRLLGTFPAGVTQITGLAAQPRSSRRLDIWITTPHGNNSPTTDIRYGQYDYYTGRITWSPNSKESLIYWSGFSGGTAQDGSFKLFSMLDYMTSKFSWFTPLSNGDVDGGSGERNFSNTDHAYLHPEGHYDRFAPAGLSYLSSDRKFYGLDAYLNSNTGRRAWVFARIPVNAMRP